MSAVEDVRREPLEYRELPAGHPLVRAACPEEPACGPLWARRAVYRLGGPPILVQEVFLPALGRCD
jgi:chorismate-pyruvate lyase